MIGRRRRILTVPGMLLSHLYAEAWIWSPLETGGLLLGNSRSGCIDVTRVVGAGPGGHHERHRFEPDAGWQAAEIAAEWGKDPTVEYLGDWHTHPGGGLRFSNLDIAAAQTIASYEPARQPSPVMVVLALRADGSTRVRAGQLIDGRLESIQLWPA